MVRGVQAQQVPQEQEPLLDSGEDERRDPRIIPEEDPRDGGGEDKSDNAGGRMVVEDFLLRVLRHEGFVFKTS